MNVQFRGRFYDLLFRVYIDHHCWRYATCIELNAVGNALVPTRKGVAEQTCMWLATSESYLLSLAALTFQNLLVFFILKYFAICVLTRGVWIPFGRLWCSPTIWLLKSNRWARSFRDPVKVVKICLYNFNTVLKTIKSHANLNILEFIRIDLPII